MQDFAATLSRIRSHRPNKKKNEEVKSPLALDVTPEKGPSSKMTLLRKQMEENRLEKPHSSSNISQLFTNPFIFNISIIYIFFSKLNIISYRAILEQRGKLINEHKQSVEGMVEKLSAQLSEKDFAVEEMRRSRQVEENLPSFNVCTYQIFCVYP